LGYAPEILFFFNVVVIFTKHFFDILHNIICGYYYIKNNYPFETLMGEYDSSDFESDSKDFLKNGDFKEGFEEFNYSQPF